MTDIDSILSRIQSWAAAKHGRRARLARETGIHQAQLSHIAADDWNPTASTIRALDAAVLKFTAQDAETKHELP